jgi:type I restriction enzyme S subunit
MKKGWSEVALGEVLHWRAPDTEVAASESYDFAGAYSHGAGIFRKHRVSGSSIAYNRLTRLRKDEFVYPKLMAWEGALGLVPPNCDGCFVSPEFQVFQIHSARLHPRFFDFYMRRPRVWSDLGRLSPGTNLRRRRLNAAEFLKYRISMPPLAEQQRLVAHLDAIESRLTRAQKLRVEFTQEARALVASLRSRIFGTEPAADWVPLSTYVSNIESGKSPATEGHPASDDEWGVLKLGAVSFGSFDERENKALPISFAVQESLEVQSGDFLMSRANTTQLVGACALVRETRPKLMLSDKIFRFSFRESVPIVPDYLDQVLKSPALRTQIERGASGTSPTMKNISQSKVLALRVPRFTIPKQEHILAELSSTSIRLCELERKQTRAAVGLNALLPSLLDRIFNS